MGGVTNKFSQVGEFANLESMNHEDRLSVFFISRRQGSTRPAERHGEAEGGPG